MRTVLLRISRAIASEKNVGFKKEDIVICCEDYGIDGIPCIKADIDTQQYDSYLAIVPGKFLSDIYKKYADILIGAPKPLMLEEEDFSILGIREYTWQWPSQMYPSDTLLLAQGLTREEYYSRFLPAIWKVDGVDDKLLIRAIREARSARFEFGETPKGR